MQQPTRYYITRRGGESTVRSVRIARSVSDQIDAQEVDTRNQGDRSSTESERQDHRFDVKKLLPGAIKKRVPDM